MNAKNQPLSSSSIGNSLKLIKQQLVLLLHAHKCHRRESQSIGDVWQCMLPHCATMKNVLRHLPTCQADLSCPVPHCWSSKKILSHWINCEVKSDCSVCYVLIQANELRGVVGSSSDNTVPTAAAQAAGSDSSDSLATNQLVGENQATANPVFQPKEWHQAVCHGLREHLIHKMLHAILALNNGPQDQYQPMHILERTVRQVEEEMFWMADSRSHYYHLLITKIDEIHKEQEEIKQHTEAEQNMDQLHGEVQLTNQELSFLPGFLDRILNELVDLVDQLSSTGQGYAEAEVANQPAQQPRSPDVDDM